mmetsp:Transcript_22196/g.51197  ORF Transcript_22196/g.51197 Transcript_22196/m.51197 type:complete len:97 (+) Transcript_22196:534-824(+)
MTTMEEEESITVVDSLLPPPFHARTRMSKCKACSYCSRYDKKKNNDKEMHTHGCVFGKKKKGGTPSPPPPWDLFGSRPRGHNILFQDYTQVLLYVF